MGRRDENPVELLLKLFRVVPFWVGPIVAFAIYAVLAWLIPAIFETPNPKFSAESPEKSVAFGQQLLATGFARGMRMAAPFAAIGVMLLWLFAEATKLFERWSRAKSHPPASSVGASPVIACPDCGAEMQKRTARQGKNQGSQFWGCTRYPKCRGTRNIA